MVIGIIGGSGLYQLSEDGDVEALNVETPYGATSTPIYRTKVGNNTALFLSRHGKGHTISPTEINYRANIYAMKKLGASYLISVSAVGSMREEIKPGDFVFPHQYIDRTRGIRPATFFEGGIVGHAHFADPTCSKLRELLIESAKAVGVKYHTGGSYVCMEGPQFSTRAESHWYRSWDLGEHEVKVIGMTALPEAKLAMEAGICYQTVAMATDYDCWHESEEDVSVEAIIKVLMANVDTSRKLVFDALSREFPPCRTTSGESTVITDKKIWPDKKRELMDLLLSQS